jgi:predicted RNase H-like HicB family nuclease
MNITYDAHVFQERDMYVAHCPQLDVASCGRTVEEARGNLAEAVRLFLEEAGKLGTLQEILDEAGYEPDNGALVPPKLVSAESMAVTIDA